MIPCHPVQQPCRRMRALPIARELLVRLGSGRVGMDGAEDSVQADAMAHRKDKLAERICRVITDNGRTQYRILARHGEHLDQAMRCLIRNRPTATQSCNANAARLDATSYTEINVTQRMAHWRDRTARPIWWMPPESRHRTFSAPLSGRSYFYRHGSSADPSASGSERK